MDAYLDGELTGPLVDELGAHRIECADCRQALDLLEVAGQVMATDSNAPKPAEDFTNRVLAESRRQAAGRSRRRWIYVGAPFAAAAVIAFALIGPSTTKQQPVEKTVSTEVAGFSDQVNDLDELRGNVTEALRHDPDNTQLRRLLDLLDSKGRDVIEKTRDGTKKLETYGKKTMIEVLESIERDLQSDSNQPSAVEHVEQDRASDMP